MRSIEDDDPSLNGGRRQYLTVLFSDLAGSTRFGERMEAEDFAEMLGSLRILCRTVIAKHGGQIARIQSDGVLAIFGYDGVQEDDGRRAAEAALDLHQSVSQMRFKESLAIGETLALHSGIHAGVCFVDRGDVERGRFEVLGDVPNLAARLADMAGPGDLCISEETLGPSANFFEIRGKQVVNIKGRAVPLSMCTIVGRAKARTRFEAGAARGLAPFVGRELEARSLQSHLLSAIRGAPQCVMIVGNPGVGKTRLLEELVRHVEGQRCLVLRGFCESYLSAEPLQPFLQILRGVQAPTATTVAGTALSATGSTLSDDLVSIAKRALHPAMSLIGSSAEAPSGVFGTAVEILRDAFDSLAADVPLMLVVDDWQWADDTSVQIVDAIRALKRPIFVLLAMREADVDQLNMARGETLRLGALTLEAVTRSVRHLVPGADPFLVADIHRDSGGNPLFVEELCHSAAARVVERPSEKAYRGSAWLASLIESRVARLDPQDARAVRVASVLGNVFPRSLLAQVASIEVDDEQVRALASQDFIYPAEQLDMLRFKHGITREVVYASVGLHERISIHVAVARVLDKRSDQEPRDDLLEVLAYHYAEGMLPLEAARFSELAGDKAMAAHALDRARLQYGATLTALDKVFVSDRTFLLKWCAVAQKLGMTCVFDALALTDAAKLLMRGVDLARQSQDPAALARAEYWLSYIYYAKGRGREAMQHCQVALETAERLGDERLLAQLRATLGQICASVCRYDESLSLLNAAIDSKRARSKPGGKVAVGSAFALAIKGSVLGDRGQFAEAEECFAEMLWLLDGSVHQVVSSVRNWIGVVYLWQGRWADAMAVVEASMHVAENVKSHLLLALSKSIWGYGNWQRTGTAESLQAVSDGTNWIALRGGSLGSSLNYGWLLDIAETVGSDTERRQHAAILLRRARQHDRLGEAMGCRALARAAAKAHDAVAAERYLALAERSAQARGSRHEQAATLLCRAEICMLNGQARAAVAPLDGASEAFTSMHMTWHLQQAQALRRLL
jgi:class 3 adenylate cyclase/tetratricopeptide (TPR) repeat protein